MTNLQERIDKVRNMLACFLIGSFVGSLAALMFKGIPGANEQIVTYMVGQLSGMATTVLAFYFTNKAGQDQADAEKTANTGRLADAVNKALDATPPAVDENAIRDGDAVVVEKK